MPAAARNWMNTLVKRRWLWALGLQGFLWILLYVFRRDIYLPRGGPAPAGMEYFLHYILTPFILLALWTMPLTGAVLVAPTFRGAFQKSLCAILFIVLLSFVTIYIYGVTVGVP